MAEEKKETGKFVLYEDKEIVAFLERTPATFGHIILTTKEHYPIFENIPDRLVGKLFSASSKLSSILFESLNSHGTNIIIQNGVAAGQDDKNFKIHIIARRENDSINFQWVSKQFNDEEMGLAELQLKEETKDIGVEKAGKTETINKDNQKIEKLGGEENYLIKQLYRMP